MTPSVRHRLIVRKFMCGRTAPPSPTTTPRIRRRSVQTLARTTPLDDQTPRESGRHQGSRASRSPRAPRARAFDLVRARMRHRFASAKGPARRTSGAPDQCPHQPPQPSPPRASSRIERPLAARGSRARVASVQARSPPNHPKRGEPNTDGVRCADIGSPQRTAGASPTPSPTTAPPDRGTADSHDTSPSASLRLGSAEKPEQAATRSSSPESRTKCLPSRRDEVHLREPRRLCETAESAVRHLNKHSE
jgi:hypothetical protein